MVDEVASYDTKRLFGVSRAFANFLALANSAEHHHRARRLRMGLIDTQSPYGISELGSSCVTAIKNLKSSGGVTEREIWDALQSQKVEIVLTAHPTEVNRRSLLLKHRRIKELLEFSDRPDLTNYEINKIERELKGEIFSIWSSDDLRRNKPTPVDEAKSGLFILETVLWNAVPNFIRKLDDLSRKELGAPLPLESSPIKMASWMVSHYLLVYYLLLLNLIVVVTYSFLSLNLC